MYSSMYGVHLFVVVTAIDFSCTISPLSREATPLKRKFCCDSLGQIFISKGPTRTEATHVKDGVRTGAGIEKCVRTRSCV